MSAVPGGGRASRGDPAGAVPAPVARGPASPSPSAPTPVRKVGDRFRRRRRGRGFAIAFLLINAGPAAAAIWWFTQPESERQRLLEKIPSGVATRAASAGIAFALLLALALVVLPGARGAIEGLARALAWVRSRPRGLRIALFPVEAVLGVLWFVAQMLFAVDAIAILACAAAFVGYVVRILKPDLLGFLPG